MVPGFLLPHALKVTVSDSIYSRNHRHHRAPHNPCCGHAQAHPQHADSSLFAAHHAADKRCQNPTGSCFSPHFNFQTNQGDQKGIITYANAASIAMSVQQSTRAGAGQVQAATPQPSCL